jgi:DDE superfamily endonuclease
LWQFPNCIGAVDGKLVRIQRPIRCGGSFYNYKKTFSINLMAVVDAHYRFLYVNIGAQGSVNDAAIYNASSFSEALADSNNPLNIPGIRSLPGTNTYTPMMLVADEAYPLRPHIMKPFSSRGLSASERIFNYRLSRARRVVENAFGILSNRFRIFHSTLHIAPSSAEDVVLAACSLHNFLRSKAMSGTEMAANDTEMADTENEEFPNIQHVRRQTGANYNAISKNIRDDLATYFITSGQVPWQWKHANMRTSHMSTENEP